MNIVVADNGRWLAAVPDERMNEIRNAIRYSRTTLNNIQFNGAAELIYRLSERKVKVEKSASTLILQGIWKACIGKLGWMCVLELLLATALCALNTHLYGCIIVMEFSAQLLILEPFGSDAIVIAISADDMLIFLVTTLILLGIWNVKCESIACLETYCLWAIAHEKYLCMLAHRKRVWNVSAREAQDAISYRLQVSYLFIYLL